MQHAGAPTQVMKRLQAACPQICSVLCGGQLPDERYYIVMELLGLNLVEARRAAGAGQGRYSPAAVRALALSMLDSLQVGAGVAGHACSARAQAASPTSQRLQAVHAAGYIHRDVKPANFAQVPGTAGVCFGWCFRLEALIAAVCATGVFTLRQN